MVMQKSSTHFPMTKLPDANGQHALRCAAADQPDYPAKTQRVWH
jgi:hypothetical protein